ncbi:hypothetical protein UFOVP235_47 [uncultured Caudovirales phage]|uniref:Phage tail lysozyme domain-containing protein n=1 Tax=uncultured Caudovirales phage TaxID=2100421 RepID=A0A6J7WQP1_9CAUD|nr:hypothetical protein UFOVP235_47 [uncultured Caudovirales phage]
MANNFSPNAQAAYSQLLALGYQPHQAAGIVGNLMAESGPGVSPTIPGDKGKAIGIAQWRDSRRQELMRFAAKGGMDPHALDTQVKFLDSELRTTERSTLDAINRSSTPQEAATAFLGFERPLGYTQRNPQQSSGYDARVSNAAAIHQALGLGSPQPSTAPPDQSSYASNPTTNAPPSPTSTLQPNIVTGELLDPNAIGTGFSYAFGA